MRAKGWLNAGGSVLLLLGSMITASARPVRVWSRAELWQKADVVALVTAESNRDEAVPEPAKPDTWVPVLTRFHVQAILKGKPEPTPAADAPALTVRHYRYYGPEARIAVIDGPGFVEFDARKKREYLVFLAAGKGSAYEPLTGQYDPWQSFLHVEPYAEGAERAAP